MLSTIDSPRASNHLDKIGFSDIVQVRNKVMALRAAGISVFGFHGGEPDFETPQHIKDAMTRALIDNKTRYAPSSGIEPLRAAITRKLRAHNGMDVTEENVLVTVGGIHGLQAAFESVLDPGDEIMVFSPYWTPIGDMVLMSEARPVLVPTDTARERGFDATLERFLTPKTRAIYYNTPQNPTGDVFSRPDAEQVAAFAIRHNLVVIADEAYEDIVYDGEHVSIATLPNMAARTITCFTLSKSYAMTGWRIGYVVAREPFMEPMRKVVLYTTNGVSTPVQWAAIAALETPPGFFAEKRASYRKRRDLLVTRLNQLGLEAPVPAGAFYAFPCTNVIHKDSRKAASILLDQAHIATIPGIVFGPHGEGHLRFGYAIPTETIELGLDALRNFLRP